MVVPKASVNKNGQPTRWKYDIGTARQVSPMQPESVAEPVQERTNN